MFWYKSLLLLPTEPKLFELMNEVAAVIPNQWKAVGVQLDIPAGQLDSFWTKCLGNPTECFQEVFIYWRNNPTKAYSWRSVVEVLRSAHVGETDLSEQIRNRHQL